MFTIFLVVSFITMVKAVLDVSPLVFLRMSQNNAGNFDFVLTSDYGEALVNGD